MRSCSINEWIQYSVHVGYGYKAFKNIFLHYSPTKKHNFMNLITYSPDIINMMHMLTYTEDKFVNLNESYNSVILYTASYRERVFPRFECHLLAGLSKYGNAAR